MAKRAGREVSAKEAAGILGMDRRAVLYAVEAGHIEGRKEAGFLWLLSYASIMRFKRRREKLCPQAALRSGKPGQPRRRKRV